MTDGLVWWVAHTRPRAEKKVVEHCEREGIVPNLPLYRSVKRYRGKKVEFQKPLFPGYVFVKADPSAATRLRGHRHVANLLEPPDQAEFKEQLEAILTALGTDREIQVAPHVVEGVRVRMLTGPLRGLEGRVLRRDGVIEVVLWLDVLGQGASVRVSADELEPV